MKKHVNLVDLVKSFPTNIFLQNLASIQERTSPIKFAHMAEKSEKGSISNLSTKPCTPCPAPGPDRASSARGRRSPEANPPSPSPAFQGPPKPEFLRCIRSWKIDSKIFFFKCFSKTFFFHHKMLCTLHFFKSEKKTSLQLFVHFASFCCKRSIFSGACLL